LVANGVLAQASGEEKRCESAGSVPYLSGGIGESGREEIWAAATDYNLKLVFAEAGGAFVADMKVSIQISPPPGG
jgi:hypothetical protein